MAAFSELPKSEWRKDKDKRVWRRITVRLGGKYESFTIADLRRHIQENGLGEDANFEIDSVYAYGDEEYFLEMSGWRVATPTEVTEALAQVDRTKREHERVLAEREAKTIEDLRQKHPELFK